MTAPDSIVASFQKMVAQHPNELALRWVDGSCTYAEINASANRLAHFLIKTGIRPETPVAVCALRSRHTLTAFLAILKAGGTYIPLDPANPSDRIRYCLEDANIQFVLTDHNEVSRLPLTRAKTIILDDDLAKDLPATDPICESTPASAAHIFFTSGSTGRPKGVVIEHRGVLRLAKYLDYVKVAPGETLLQFTPLNYDVSTFEIWCSWLNGACLALPPAGQLSLRDLGQALRTFNVSLLLLPSSLLPLMVDQELDSLAGVRQLMVGGDVLSPVHAERFLKKYPNANLINAYGPTENTVITTSYHIKLEKQLPSRFSIGRPIQKSGVLVLDENLQPAPTGEIGELVITGEGLARGYLNQPELTQRAFVQVTDPEGKQVRAYRSGDLASYNADGTLDFRGRMDDQVKVNGLRIELGEIKSILQSHPQVAEAEVLLVENAGSKQLKTFVVPKQDAHIDEQSLREFLEQKIPSNWRPYGFYVISAFPRNAGGKVDRQALLESIRPVLLQEDSNSEGEPRNPLEKAIWNIWKEVVPGTRITLHDRFSDLGGDSLSALKMISRVEKLAGRTIGLRPLLEGGTILNIAAAARETGVQQPSPLMICTQPGKERPPFFFAHGDYTCGGLYCYKLAAKLDRDQPLYSIAPQGTFGGELPTSFEETAAGIVKLITSVQPKGPYHLGGYCNGALAIYEVAQQLIRSGEVVKSLVLLDPPELSFFLLRRRVTKWGRYIGLSEGQGRNNYQRIAEGIEIWQAHGTVRLLIEVFRRVYQSLSNKWRRFVKADPVNHSPNLNLLYYELIARYEPRPYPSSLPVWIILRDGEDAMRPQQVNYWRRFTPNARFEVVPGTHLELQGSIGPIAHIVRAALQQANEQQASKEFPSSYESSLKEA